MDLIQFQRLFNKEPRYRLKQVKKALFQDLIQNWQEATALPLNIREELNKKCPIEVSAKTFISKDKNAIKAFFILKDDLKVESVLVRHADGRNTVCVSSQVGCPLGCKFCATGKMGFKRNLEAWEIVEQVLFFARYLKKIKDKVTNIVFMGMGEPFLNYQNVIEAIKILNDKEGFNLGARHFSVSTVGIVEGIEKLAKEKLQINLAISLHAPDDELRSKLMPINKKYSLKKILNAVDSYIEKTRRRVMFEYIMINNLNDSENDAKTLAKLMKKPRTRAPKESKYPTGRASTVRGRPRIRASTVRGRPLYFINLISYNALHFKVLPSEARHGSYNALHFKVLPSEARHGSYNALHFKVLPSEARHGSYNATGNFKPSSFLRIKKFKEILEKEGVMVTQRYRFGKDIEGACGQLAAEGGKK